MSYGLEVRGPNGAKVVGLGQKGVLSYSSVQVPTGNGTWSWSFPALAGRTCKAVIFAGMYGDYIAHSWTYPAGVPTLSATRTVQAYSVGGQPAPAFIYVQ